MTFRFTLTPCPPYSFPLTIARFARFKDETVDRIHNARYQRLLSADGQLALATVTNAGSISQPCLQVELRGSRRTDCDRPEFITQLRHILCTDLDLKPFYRLARCDDLLAPPVVCCQRGRRVGLDLALFFSFN